MPFLRGRAVVLEIVEFILLMRCALRPMELLIKPTARKRKTRM